MDALFLQPLDSMDLNGSQWISMDLNGSQWISMDLNGSQWISMDLNGSQWISMVWGVIHSWGPVWPRKLRPLLRCIDGLIFLFPTLTSPAPWCPAPRAIARPLFWGPEIWIQISLDRFTPPLGISNHKVRVQFAGSDNVYNFHMCVCVCLSIDVYKYVLYTYIYIQIYTNIYIYI